MGEAETSGAKAKILVADDEGDVRELCLRTLRLGGYQVTGVADGPSAIEAVRRESFDLFLTDIKMPGMTGLEAYRRIRDLSPETTAVVITGFGTTELAIEALKAGVAEFVVKPFTPQQLATAIRRALERRRLERENARLRAIIPLFELSQAFMSTVDLSALLERVVRTAAEETGADRCSLMLLDETRGELTVRAAQGLPAEVIASTRRKVGEGISGWVAEHGEPLIIHGDAAADPRLRDASHSEGIATAISLPLKTQDRVIGVLNVAKGPDAESFSESEVDLLSVLGSQAAIAIDNARLFREIQEAYQRVSELDHMKSEFISIAAHELRTPLAVVLAYAALLEEEVDESLGEYLKIVIDAALQLKGIIDDMLSLSHVEAGKGELKLAEVSMHQVVAEVMSDVARLVDGKGHTVVVNLPHDLPTFQADAEKLQLILSCLVSNAVKFTPAGGRIEIAAMAEGQDMLISVSDDGIGMPAEAQERVFERFYQVEESLRREYQGIGLGLPVAKAMVELHGGRIWVESEIGEGSTFYCRIPLGGLQTERRKEIPRGKSIA